MLRISQVNNTAYLQWCEMWVLGCGLMRCEDTCILEKYATSIYMVQPKGGGSKILKNVVTHPQDFTVP